MVMPPRVGCTAKFAIKFWKVQHIQAIAWTTSGICLAPGSPPQFLVTVHLAVGDAEQFTGIARVLGIIDDADADAAADHARTQIERGLIDIMSYTLNHASAIPRRGPRP